MFVGGQERSVEDFSEDLDELQENLVEKLQVASQQNELQVEAINNRVSDVKGNQDLIFIGLIALFVGALGLFVTLFVGLGFLRRQQAEHGLR